MSLRVMNAVTRAAMSGGSSADFADTYRRHSQEPPMTPTIPPPDTVEDLRLLIYRQFARRGHTGEVDELSRLLGITTATVEEGLRRLHATRDLVLADTGEIVLAHPFATQNFGFSVMGADTLWWGGCAWDAFAIAHLVPREPDTLVATRCPYCGSAHAWNVERTTPPAGSQVVHFATPMAHVWDDVVHACRNQRIFCDDDCLDAQLSAEPGRGAGARFDIATLWRLARHWYAGRLDRGYRRRDPAAATEYFASVGLTGPFWTTATTPTVAP